jgi:hypothetical protein
LVRSIKRIGIEQAKSFHGDFGKGIDEEAEKNLDGRKITTDSTDSSVTG